MSYEKFMDRCELSDNFGPFYAYTVQLYMDANESTAQIPSVLKKEPAILPHSFILIFGYNLQYASVYMNYNKNSPNFYPYCNCVPVRP